MYKIAALNKIAGCGLAELEGFDLAGNSAESNPDGIMVRSADMQSMPLNANLLAIARAGAGYNNIPVGRCSDAGIVVFNTPGANANAVKELVIAGLLLSSRKIAEGIAWARALEGVDIEAQVEKGKGNFAGPEIMNKKLGVIGMGAIGAQVANAAESLGMEVMGFDPYLSVDAAWGLSRNIVRAKSVDEIARACDYVTIHLPLTDETRGMFDAAMFAKMKKGARLLNFARGEIVDNRAVIAALSAGTLACYITDFPSADLLRVPGVIPLPHLGASTPEAEDNCAIMAARQLKNYLLHGNIKNSVNLPDCDMGPATKPRITVINRNVAGVVGPITSILADAKLNIADMTNKSRNDYAYNIIDIDGFCSGNVIGLIEQVPGVVRVRLINGGNNG